MPDIFSKAKRSEVMSRIRSHGNKDTELALIRVFRAHRITGWRRQQKLRVGELRVDGRKKSTSPRRILAQHSTINSQPRSSRVRPDFIFPKLRLAVFVDGCFWHACPRHCRMPAGNRAFWRAKLARNQARDRLVTRSLRKAGWRVLRIWEHTLKKLGRRNAEPKSVAETPSPRPSPPLGERVTAAGEREARLVARVRRALAKEVSVSRLTSIRHQPLGQSREV